MSADSAPELPKLCGYVSTRTGSSLSQQQRGRLVEAAHKRMAGRSEDVYLAFLQSSEGTPELAELMASISVHKTDLFRDEVQLRAFTHSVLEPLAKTGRPLRLWSAGCATGEEVATLLILLEEAHAHPESTVLGTDISDSALKTAKAFTFHPELMKRVPPPLKARYFKDGPNGHSELVSQLQQRARFARHNLMDVPYPVPPVGDGFDVIFCRNVLIYFTEAAFDSVVGNLAERLVAGGTLVLSAAEPLLKPHATLSTFKCDQAFFYQRTPKAVAPAQPAPLLTPPGGVRVTVVPIRAPAAAPPPSQPPRASSAPAAAPPAVVATPLDPKDEATQIFQLVLDWAAAGQPDEQTEQGLRRCLYLDPHLAQARYLLGTLLEQRAALADAAAEYRRALAALTEGKSRPTPFFLNNERLKGACLAALKRLGYGA
jgi:chemotaxis protein methyltransferase CheR